MSIVTRCGAVGFVLGLLAGAVPGLAQTVPAEGGGSSWTDPPVRGTAGPESPAAATPAAPKPEIKTPPAAAEAPGADASARKQAAAPPATPAERAAAKLGVAPVEASSRRDGSGTQARCSPVRPRMVEPPLVIARRPGRTVERMASRPVRHAARTHSARHEPVFGARADAADRRSHAPYWQRRRLAGWNGLIDDSPASRIARARAAGYTLMRMRTYAYPDGTLVRQLLPYGSGDLD